MLNKEQPKGFLGQELQTGDKVLILTRSGQSHVMKPALISYIGFVEKTRTKYPYDHVEKKYLPPVKEQYMEPVVKVRTKLAYHSGQPSHPSNRPYTKRIYYWQSAYPITEFPKGWEDLDVPNNG